jgi:hypothetical protein
MNAPIRPPSPENASPEQIFRAILATDFRAFVDYVFGLVRPGIPFKSNWHIDAICDHLEAVSRGAAFALFVDNGAEARALLRNNVESLGLGGVTKVFRRDAGNLGPAHPVEPFSLVFLDPPYARKLAEKALASLRDGGWLTPGALLVVEEAKAAGFAAPDGFEELERRVYDDTEFVFLRAVTPS